MHNSVAVPTFDLGVQYNEQSPKDGNYKYRFVTIDDITISFENDLIPEGYLILFKDKLDRVWMVINHNEIIISKNYAWDGCTPKKWWGMWWGTPDFKKTIIASLIHDSLIQFSNCDHFPFTRDEIDQVFRNILSGGNFTFTPIYYLGVKVGSMIYTKPYSDVFSEIVSQKHE